MAVQAAWRGFTVRAELRRHQLAATSIQVRHMSHFTCQGCPLTCADSCLCLANALVLLDSPKLISHHQNSCIVAKMTRSNCRHGG